MECSIKVCDWSKVCQHEENRLILSERSEKIDCLVVGIFEAQTLSVASIAAAQVDQAAQGLVTHLVQSGDINGKLGTTLMLYEVPNIGATRILLVGLGQQDDFGPRAFLQATRAAWSALSSIPLRRIVWSLAQLPVNERDAAWAVRMSIVLAREVTYQFTRMKSQPEVDKHVPEAILFTVDAAVEDAVRTTLQQGIALANGADFARELANLPANICTPNYLADSAKHLAREFKLKVEVFNQKQIEKLKMGAFLSVAKGSAESPKFILLQYQGDGAKAAPVVLIGKGITFDSGGISLKPSKDMDEMKYDMCGAAAVFGTLRAVAEMQLKVNLIGVIPTCENMPAGNANKPGDIVTSLSGQTIEILNTDAEGRLILCDALTFVERFKPAAVIDIATLTGACVIALGHHRSGLYAKTKDDALANELLAAATKAADPAWRMPLDEEYQDQLKSNFADMTNVGGRPAGSVTAACFLSRFAAAYPWAHLDIAGTAWKSGKEKGATARPVALLTQFLIDRASKA